MPVDREGASGRKLVPVAHGHDERSRTPHFGVEKTDGVGLGVIRSKRVGADELREILGWVHRGFCLRAHFVKDDRHARLSQLPSCLRAGEAAADDIDRSEDCVLHDRDMCQNAELRQD